MDFIILKEVGKFLLTWILSDKYVQELIVHFMEYLSKKTDNKIDDKAVEIVKGLVEHGSIHN